ncbi:DUF3291 domain-containing protein [Kordiimonas lipolytica]|uniref:DUF3291 domain-containing protein n=1 Tax=Kordiimonas lipolytica TaxID=1662421 RepID=A0ABV8UG38_9PROT|nr:DUF3291 domain-containing protein [Kordiimonas lipolytica]
MPRSNHPGEGFSPANFELAQLNVGKIKYPKDSPEMADFVSALDHINGLAEQSDGFIWRLKDESGSAMSFSLFDDDTLPNLSVWRDRESLFTYVYKTAHTDYLARRKEWFHMPSEGHLVLWWVPKGHRPTIEEAARHLEYLRKNGPTPMAFTFKRAFGADGEPLVGKPVAQPV